MYRVNVEQLEWGLMTMQEFERSASRRQLCSIMVTKEEAHKATSTIIKKQCPRFKFPAEPDEQLSGMGTWEALLTFSSYSAQAITCKQ